MQKNVKILTSSHGFQCSAQPLTTEAASLIEKNSGVAEYDTRFQGQHFSWLTSETRNLKPIKRVANLLAANSKYYSAIDLLLLLLDNKVIQSYQLEKCGNFLLMMVSTLNWLAEIWGKISLWVSNQPVFLEVAIGIALFYVVLLISRALFKFIVFLLSGLFSVRPRFKIKRALSPQGQSKPVKSDEEAPPFIFR